MPKLLQKKQVEKKVLELLKSSDGLKKTRTFKGFISIDVNESNKKDIYQICDFYRARKIENENNSIIFEIAGASQRINSFVKEISEITKNEIVRSGPVAISTYDNNEVRK